MNNMWSKNQRDRRKNRNHGIRFIKIRNYLEDKKFIYENYSLSMKCLMYDLSCLWCFLSIKCLLWNFLSMKWPNTLTWLQETFMMLRIKNGLQKSLFFKILTIHEKKCKSAKFVLFYLEKMLKNNWATCCQSWNRRWAQLKSYMFLS